jgi:hypothetical protein
VEHRLRVSEKSVLRRIFATKRNEIPGDWRELHNEELSTPGIIRKVSSRRWR